MLADTDTLTASTLERIAEFNAHILAGMASWEKAGAILAQLYDEIPDVANYIVAEHPHLTLDILDAFVRIGRRQLYPQLLLDNSIGARALAALPYEQQVELYHKEVTVLRRNRSTDMVERQTRRISKLTTAEVEILFTSDGRLRTPDEQKSLLPPPRKFNAAPGLRRETPPPPPGPRVVVVDSARESLDERVPDDHRHAAIHFLEKAQAALTRAREELSQMPGWRPESIADNLITQSVTPMTKLRFLLTQNQS